MTPTQSAHASFESTWTAWQLQRNRRGMRTMLLIVLVLYPLFAILDTLAAPKEWLWLLYSTRALITLLTLVMLRIVNSPIFSRNVNLISSSFLVLISTGISLMTVFMGGLASPYYAGLSLTIVGTGLLFVWPRQVVVGTHTAIVCSFLVPNLLLGNTADLITSVSNLFFVVSTAIIVGTGQILVFASQREQIASHVVLEQTQLNLRSANDELKQLDRFKSKFFANITHELRTPLTMVLAPLELLLDGELGHISDAQRSTFSSMQRSGVKLLRLIADLLDLSRLEESRVRLRIEEHDLVAYLRDLVLETSVLAERKGIELTFESNAEKAAIWCDLERIERVFVNLLSNATKFTESGGRIEVSLQEGADEIIVRVDDTGVGFPPGTEEKIFSRFYQAEMGSARRYGGTGIGLALAKELVELHGGEISATSVLGEGSKFVVLLRKGRDHFKPDALDRRAGGSVRPNGKREEDVSLGDWRGPVDSKFRLLPIDEQTEQRVVERDSDELHRVYSVLIVEDTPDVIRMVRLALHHEFRVLAARDGKRGLDLARKHRPTVIITDLMMPVMDGLEFTSQIRDDKQLKHTPVLMLTARNEVESRVTGLQTGVNAYIAKPFSTKELVTAVRSLVKSQEATADIVLSQKMDSLETVAGGLAHEIGNPLNYVKNSISSIQQDTTKLLEGVRNSQPPSELEVQGVADRLSRLFAVSEAGVRRIGATVDLMVRYSRDGFSRVFQPYDVYDAVAEVLGVVLPGLDREVDVESDLSGSGLVECVPEEFHQVLTNLIQNAVEACPSDGTGRLRILGHNEGETLVLAVKDNGHGISAADLNSVFGAFFTTKDTGKGMGLGLTIAYRVVRALGGTIDVESEPGVETTFTIRVPLVQASRFRAHNDVTVDAQKAS